MYKVGDRLLVEDAFVDLDLHRSEGTKYNLVRLLRKLQNTIIQLLSGHYGAFGD